MRTESSVLCKYDRKINDEDLGQGKRFSFGLCAIAFSVNFAIRQLYMIKQLIRIRISLNQQEIDSSEVIVEIPEVGSLSTVRYRQVTPNIK